MSKPKIAIVGAGLAGVYAAYRLQRAGIDFDLFEARTRLGGRILSTDSGGLDLGPTWFWPDFQPRMHNLLAELGLPIFDQYEDGDALLDRGPGQVLRRQGYRSGNPALRIKGGTARLIAALASKLPAARIHLQTQVLAARQSDDGVRLRLAGAGLDQPVYDQLWLALPPRLASQLDFSPALPAPASRRLAEVPTWMAAHGKYVARYARPFWRNRGLSGDAFSSVGPLGEIHDASNGEAAALFGFFVLGAAQRRAIDQQRLKTLCRAQLTRLFGEAAGSPIADWVQDWAADALIATPADQIPPRWHSTHDLDGLLEAPWRDRLLLVGSEAGGEQGGYMEGALMAVDKALDSYPSR